jgi:hypothetical protein
MPKKALVLYGSVTGNTEKVAKRFKQTFEKNGWDCDMMKVDKNTINGPSINFDNYDFLCVGSPVWSHHPYMGIIDVMRASPQHVHHVSAQKGLPPVKQNEGVETVAEKIKNTPEDVVKTHALMKAMSPGSKKGIAFATYSGAHLGPKEAEPSLALLALEIEHVVGFSCVGRFSCPGKVFNFATNTYWHGDISQRPDERDLMKAEIFLEELLEEPF